MPSSVATAAVISVAADEAGEDVPGLRAEAQQPGGPPAGRGGELAVLEQPDVDGLLHALGDHLAAQAGLLLERRPGHRSAGPHEVDQRPWMNASCGEGVELLMTTSRLVSVAICAVGT